jgi:hypothetical protein
MSIRGPGEAVGPDIAPADDYRSRVAPHGPLHAEVPLSATDVSDARLLGAGDMWARYVLRDDGDVARPELSTYAITALWRGCSTTKDDAIPRRSGNLSVSAAPSLPLPTR